MRMTKAVIPAAGLGTRFLPATKAIPKELLPIVDTPALEYVVREAAAAGLRDVLLITGKTKGAILDHFDRAWDLEATLEAKGDFERLTAVRASAQLATIHAVRQAAPRGLGDAVLRARRHVGSEPFAVLLGDDLIDPRDPLLTTMMRVRDRLGGSVVALMRVPREQISLYGSASATLVDADRLAGVEGLRRSPGGASGASDNLGVYQLSDLVEKPEPGAAPSDLAIIGRYVLNPAVFDVLERTAPGHSGEVQLTDALGALAEMPAENGGGLHGVLFTGRRYDTGDRLDYLKAVVRLTAEHPELGPEFAEWLTDFALSLGASVAPRAGRDAELGDADGGLGRDVGHGIVEQDSP
ncbi:MAG: UTP--glucose-1-phosphate uridylyltransferase [Bifidobacteriaceae bacterium]|jgi:UTP--glucose-1-phosphate uridylyltransferase|nr:UTP--glucose-1-phosphate uridylyltransferase [Bifidobacteriaceae bacterium]